MRGQLTRDLEHLEPLLRRYAKVGQRLFLERRLLRLHDVRQARVARLV